MIRQGDNGTKGVGCQGKKMKVLNSRFTLLCLAGYGGQAVQSSRSKFKWQESKKAGRLGCWEARRLGGWKA